MSEIENFVKDLERNLGFSGCRLTYSEAMNIVKTLAIASRGVSTADHEPLQLGPFGAMYRCFEDLQRRVIELEKQIKLVTDNPAFYQASATKLPVFTQEMFPVSIESVSGETQMYNTFTTVKFKGLVKVGDAYMAPTDLTVYLNNTAPFTRQLDAAVRGRKKYKLTLEETEETF